MKINRLHKVPAFFAALTIVFFVLPVAHASTLEKLQQEQKTLFREIQTQKAEILSTSKQLDTLAGEIRDLKTEIRQKPSLLKKYRLQSLLQEAQKISDLLQNKEQEKRKNERLLKKTYEHLARALDKKIRALRLTANSKDEPVPTRRSAAKELARLSLKRLQILVDLAVAPLPHGAANLLENGDSPEEISERLNAVRDFERRILREQKNIQKEVRELKRTRFLRTEIAHLLEEEAFFGERGFIRGGPARQGKTDLSALARLKSKGDGATETDGDVKPITDVALEAEEGVPTAETPPASEEIMEEVAGETPLETQTDIESVVPGSALSSETDRLATGEDLGEAGAFEEPDIGNDLQVRDPLARLAHDFGVTSEAGELRAISAGASMNTRIRWLQRRLSTTHRILKLLRKRAERLEQKRSR